MKSLERIIHSVGRFAVGFGCGLALVCAFVIAETDIGLGAPRPAQPVEVIHLDPVTVTISAERYSAIRAEMHHDTVLVRSSQDAKRSKG